MTKGAPHERRPFGRQLPHSIWALFVLEDGQLVVGGDVGWLLSLTLVEEVDIALNLFVRERMLFALLEGAELRCLDTADRFGGFAQPDMHRHPLPELGISLLGGFGHFHWFVP